MQPVLNPRLIPTGTYSTAVPAYLGVKVKPDVDVDVHFSAADR